MALPVGILNYGLCLRLSVVGGGVLGMRYLAAASSCASEGDQGGNDGDGVHERSNDGVGSWSQPFPQPAMGGANSEATSGSMESWYTIFC